MILRFQIESCPKGFVRVELKKGFEQKSNTPLSANIMKKESVSLKLQVVYPA